MLSKPSFRVVAGSGTIGVAVALRAVIGAAVSFVIFHSLQPSQSTAFFQVLLLQSVFTTFVSASGFVQAAQLRSDHVAAERLILQYVVFSLLAGMAAYGAAAVLLPADYLGVTRAAQQIAVTLLLVGSIASALGALLQGALVQDLGRKQVFGATIFGYVAILPVATIVWYFPGVIQLALVMAIIQAVPIGSLVARFETARKLIGRALRGRRLERHWGLPDTFVFMTGIANTLFLGASFAFREAWRPENPSQVTTTSFFMVRIFELLFQILSLVMASAPSLIRALECRLEDRSIRLIVAGLATLYLAVIAAILLCLPVPSDHLSLVIFFMAAELAILPLRVLGAFASISTLHSRNSLGYLFLNFFSMGALAICALWPTAFSSPVALQLAYGGGSWAVALFRVLVFPPRPRAEA